MARFINNRELETEARLRALESKVFGTVHEDELPAPPQSFPGPAPHVEGSAAAAIEQMRKQAIERLKPVEPVDPVEPVSEPAPEKQPKAVKDEKQEKVQAKAKAEVLTVSDHEEIAG